MFPASELQGIFRPTYLLGLCFIFLLAYILRKAKSRKTVMLPTFENNNNTLLWLLDFYKNVKLFKKSTLKSVSSIAYRYRKNGLFHLKFAFCDIVFLFHPDTVQPLLQSTSNIDKPHFYKFFNKGLALSLGVIGGKKWYKNRKLLTPAFHFRGLETFLPVIEEQSKILVERLSNCEENGSIDIFPLVSHYLMNILCETALGLRSRKSHYDSSNFEKHLNIGVNATQERIKTIWMWPDIIFRFTQASRDIMKSVDYLHKMINQIIEERISQLKNEDQNNTLAEEQYYKRKPLAFLDILLNSASNDPDYTLEDITDEVLLFLSAGTHSTSVTITWTLYLLGKHPDVQKKVQEEVDAVFGDDPEKPLSMGDFHKLKYTECVIKEAMRLYPIGPLIGRKISKELTIGDYKIPEGFICVICIQDVHKNPDIFPNPDVFDPERFFPENCLGRHPFAYLPFSAGPRNCIARKFAMIEMKIIVAKLMQSLTFESLDENVETNDAIILQPKDPIRFKVKTR